MPQSPLPTWKSEFKNIPQDPATALEGAQNIADWIDKQVTNKLTLGPPFVGSAVYAWQPSIFAPLIILPPSPDPASGRTAMANAWQTATLAATMTVSSGSVGPPSPPTLFSAPPVTVVDPPSVTAAYATLLQGILALPLAPEIDLCTLPDLFFAAFASLTFTLTGLNSVPPPTGPLPLVDPLNPVL